jgi:MoxR-like ATPase
LALAAKVAALRASRDQVEAQDITKLALPALRHRLITNFEAQADGVTTDDLIQDILDTVPA